MRDNFIQKIVKNSIRCYYLSALWLNRKRLKRKGLPKYELLGKCEGCGKCCENPAIKVGFFLSYINTCRTIYFWWQKKINGFVFQREDEDRHIFYFLCTHWDTKTKRCDSYESRPGICRDYPRNLLYSSIPDFFEECGYKPKDKNAEKFNLALEKVNLDEEKKDQLKKKLFLK
jgi:Fe-S-cluster containining protein